MLAKACVCALAALLASTPAVAAAASWSFTLQDDAWAIYLNGDEHNGQFDTIEVYFEPYPGRQYLNIDDDGLDGTRLLQPAEPYTFVNAALDHPPIFGGQGWAVLGKSVTPTHLAYTAGPLGSVIDTSSQPGGRVFLANFYEYFGEGWITLYGAGQVVDRVHVFIFPEPATLVLAGGGAVALLAARHGRRRRRAIRP